MSDLTNRLRDHCQCDDGEFCTHCEAADVLDAIASLHAPRCCDPTWCHPCDDEWPCATYLLIHPMTVDDAINLLGVHK